MQIVANIAFLSAFYLSFAIGLTLIFGVMRIINYAHGEIFMIGGYTLYFVNSMVAGMVHGPYVLAISFILALIIGAAFGGIIYLGLIIPLRDKPFSVFLATFGLSYVLQVGVIQLFGPIGKSVPVFVPGIIKEYGVILPTQRLVVVAVTVGTILALWIFLALTKLGRAVRAAAQNKTGAVLQGVSLVKIGLVAMMVGSAISAASGVLMGSLLNINPFMGGEAIWRAFMIIIVGGVGSLPGAAIAALLFGSLDSILTATGHGQFITMIDAVIMLTILAFLPEGILGAKE